MEGRRLRALALFLVATGWSAATAAAADRDALLRTAAAEIDGDRLRRHVMVLGSDALEGRAPGSIGGDRAAAYLARTLEEIGVAPYGEDGGFLQPVPVLGSAPLPASRLRITDRGDLLEPVLGADYLLYTTGSQTWLPRPVPMVFVGYGIVAPEFDYNDYADVDVVGRVVVFLDGEPASDDPRFFAGDQPTVHAALETKVRTALARGAVASVLVPLGRRWSGAGWERQRREFGHEHMTLATSLPRHLAMVVHPTRVAPALFAKALYDLERVLAMNRDHAMRSFHLTAALSFEGVFRERSFLTPNVVGVIEGSGRRLREQLVILSAHYDHFGSGPPVGGDAIYNGVVDNAVGVAAVLEIARVLSQERFRPERSVVVLLTTAEERGNLGSRYFLEHPPVPLTRMVANVNVDGVAFRGVPEDLIGVGAGQSTLGDSLRRAARAVGMEVSEPPEEVWSGEAFSRSDQVAFAESGIPAMLVAEGFRWRDRTPEAALASMVRWFEQVYHTPADDLLQPLDFTAMSRHAGALTAVVLEIATQPLSPEWRPGVRYAYVRALQRSAEERRR